MFGLMQFQWREKGNQNYFDYRINYCGVCKSIGVLYSQESRFFLNRDIVFVADLISNLLNERELKENENFSSPNCFELPKLDEIPNYFGFLASINLVLAEYKILDDIVDEKGLKSGFSNYLSSRFSSQFDKAKNYVIKSNFQLEIIANAIENQRKIETQINLDLETYTSFTGEITGEVFAHCFKLVQKEELTETGLKLGELFGQLVYLIDAIQDLEEDWKNKRFNAIIASYNLKKPNLELLHKKALLSIIDQKINAISQILKVLFKQNKYREEIIFRFKYNLSKIYFKLGRETMDNQSKIFLIKRNYYKLISRIAFLFGLALYVILPKKLFFKSNLVEKIYSEISKDRTNKLRRKRRLAGTTHTRPLPAKAGYGGYAGTL